jgi:hypothetical protein
MECGGRATKEWLHRFALRNRFPIQSGVVVEDSRAAALHNMVASVVPERHWGQTHRQDADATWHWHPANDPKQSKKWHHFPWK